MIALTEKEEQLVESIRELPEGTAEHIMAWVFSLKNLAAGGPVDWSNTWTEEDFRDATAASLRQYQESESHPE